MTSRKRVGIPPHFYCDPLLGAPGSPPPFAVQTDQPARLTIALRERRVDLALLSPIDYARDGSLYFIVPDVAVSSSAATGSVTLHFPAGVSDIRTIAVDPSSSSEIVLAQIVLGEQFDLRPQLVPAAGTLGQMLEKADAALLVGDASLRVREEDVQMIDLVEEWSEMTGLPFVHGMWCGRERSAGAEDLASFAHLRTSGIDALPAIAAAGASRHGLPLDPEELEAILGGFQYLLTEEAEEGMTEFLRFSYYHGVLPDVAELQYYDPAASAGSDADEAPSPAGPPVR
jgi:chorismate dehydratase